MPHVSSARRLLTATILLAGAAFGQPTAQAQGLLNNWYFGARAAVSFASGQPVAATNSRMRTYEATATASDAAGNLQFYTNSDTIWTRNHQYMVGGQGIGGGVSAGQGASIVPNPANPEQFYVFVVDDGDNLLAGGLKYSLVDMSLQAGVGQVVIPRFQVTAPGLRLTEKLTTARHTNGKDTWILVHGWQNNNFYAYLLTANGLQPTPVISSVGDIHTGGGGNFQNANCVGFMRVSPDGTKLAVAVRDEGFSLFDFDAVTGQVSNSLTLSGASGQAGSYGVEFSPNSRYLYASTLTSQGVLQYDLQAGSPSAVAASGLSIASLSYYTGAIQAGPDGKLYMAALNSSALAVINSPNVRGSGCGFQAQGVGLAGRLSQLGLPNVPANTIQPVAHVPFTTSLPQTGAPTVFSASALAAPAGASYAWNFGNPASGAANVASGATASHEYTTAGIYQARLTVTHPSFTEPKVRMQSIVVAARPTATGPAAPTLFIPTVLTDAAPFTVGGLSSPTDWTLTVRDLSGRAVSRHSHYDNTWTGANQPVGIYLYTLRNERTGEQHRGRVALVK